MKKVPPKFWQYLYIGTSIFISLAIYFHAHLPDGLLHVHFLDIGQGDSVLIRSPQGQNILIDGGPGNKVLEELSAVLPFYRRQIDLMILTHPDQDHIEGLIDVLKYYKVKKVLLTGASQQSPFYKAFINLIIQKSIPFQFADQETDFQIEPNLHFDTIYPFKSLAGQAVKQPNNASIVSKLTHGQVSILFTGDIEKETEEKIIAAFPSSQPRPLQAQILKVAHHGSSTSSTPNFLNQVQPHTAILQAGFNNRHGHPHPQVLNNLQKAGVHRIWRTDLQGRLHLISNTKTWTIKPQKKPTSPSPLIPNT